MPDTYHERPSFDTLAEKFERFAEIHDHFYRPWITAALPSRGTRDVRDVTALGIELPDPWTAPGQPDQVVPIGGAQ